MTSMMAISMGGVISTEIGLTIIPTHTMEAEPVRGLVEVGTHSVKPNGDSVMDNQTDFGFSIMSIVAISPVESASMIVAAI
jgi:hypothetical protein